MFAPRGTEGAQVLSKGFGVVDVGVQLSLLENCTGFPPHTELKACAVCVHLQFFLHSQKSGRSVNISQKLSSFGRQLEIRREDEQLQLCLETSPGWETFLRWTGKAHWHLQTDTFMFLKHPQCSFS